MRQCFNFNGSLKNLTIRGFKDLKTIHQETLQNLPNLESVEISKCSISKIGPGTFSRLRKLRFLDLNRNNLKKCPPIQRLENLEHLILYDNEILSIDDVFTKSKMTPNSKLLMLDLEYNGLKSLLANCFSGLGALRSLNLARNDLTRVSDQAFAGLFNLRELDLYNTDFKMISSSVFSDLRSLRIMNLAFVEIESIEEGAFAHFSERKVEVRIQSPDSFYFPRLDELKLCEKAGFIDIDYTGDNFRD